MSYPENKMTTIIDVKQAVDSAAAYLKKLLSVYDWMLEEVELSEDERYWYVTLSALVDSAKNKPEGAVSKLPTSPLEELFRNDFERVYKIFTVDAGTGVVRSMKIRTIK